MTTPSRKADYLLLGALLVLMALVAIGAAMLAPPARAGSFWKRPSTFFNEPYGTKAAYLTLQKMGYQATRLRRPIDVDTLTFVDALAILRPIKPLTEYEEEILLEWVSEGRVLLLAPPEHTSDAESHGEEAVRLSDWFNTVAPDVIDKDSHRTVDTLITAEQSDTLLSGTKALVASNGKRFSAESPLAGPLARRPVGIIWEDELGVVGVRIRYDRGTIIALSDVYALTNEGLDEADNALWLANLAWHLTGGRTDAALAFDEYHAGFPYRDPSWLAIGRLMLAEGWGWSVGQGLLVAALALYAHGTRFGRPADVRITPRRQHGEFTTAGGRLLHDAQAADLAYKALHQYYRARICRATNLPADIGTQGLSRALATRGLAQFADWLATTTPDAHTKRLTRRDVLRLSERMHRELEILEHGA